MPELPILVVGGGPAGLEACKNIADLGYKAILVEKRDRLGGMPDEASYAALTDFRDASEAMAEMAAAVKPNDNVDVRLSSTVTAASGSAGKFEVEIQNGQAKDKVQVGAVIVATGFQHFDPGRETQQYAGGRGHDARRDRQHDVRGKQAAEGNRGVPGRALTARKPRGERVEVVLEQEERDQNQRENQN